MESVSLMLEGLQVALQIIDNGAFENQPRLADPVQKLVNLCLYSQPSLKNVKFHYLASP